MEHEKCYVFKPREERPSKRRRVNTTNDHPSWLLRKQTCRELWGIQQLRIDNFLTNLNRATLEEIVKFIKNADFSQDQVSRIPTGLVVAGPSIASHAQLFDSLAHRVTDEAQSAFVALTSSECPNLKTLLKNLIRRATSAEDEDGDEHVSTRLKGPKLLNYDLQLLYEWCKDRSPTHVVVTFQDSEAFEGPLLADAVQLFNSWLDRIPFVLLFGIATSAESFQEKLPSAAIRCLEGRKFDVVQADEALEQVFTKTIDGDQSLWLGPELSSRMIERQKDHIQSVETFVDALKYAYMSHFYANPLSIFLRKDLEFEQVSSDDLEALRNLDSFRRLVEDLIEQRDSRSVRELLESDETLFQYTKEQIAITREKIQNIIGACLVLHALRKCIPRLPSIPLSTLYVRATSGSLHSSPLLRDFLLSVKKASSDTLSCLLAVFNTTGTNRAAASLQAKLTTLLASTTDPSQPLRSAHDHRSSTLRTTVVAQKVELSKQQAALSSTDAAYSQLVDELHSTLDDNFAEMLCRPDDLFLHEIVLYDLKSPHRDVFTPRPRFAVERALAAPHDYLNCSCCEGMAGDGGTEGALSSTQPPTAILYQLYLESGSLINVNDLWLAFNAIINEDDDDEELAMALFQRSLAELKFLGLIKGSRKKTDHVAKLAWKGL